VTRRGGGGAGHAARVAAAWLLLGFIFAMFLAAAAPLALGDHSYVLRTGSMVPTMNPGDVEVVQPIGPLAARIGDIVAFRDPQWQGRLVSHRVRAIQRVRDRVNFITQGDANTGREHWSVPADGAIGRVIYRIPKLGYAVAWLGTPVGRAGVIVLPAVLLMASLLARLWRRPPDRAETPDELGA
jgi:signal peptidase I